MRTDEQRRKAVDYLNRHPEQREKARVRARAAMQTKRDADAGYRERVAFYQELVDMQGGENCLICGSPRGARRLSVDHDHATDEIRGLLCQNCNDLLGRARNSVVILQRAIDYLSRPAYTGRNYRDFRGIKSALYPQAKP
jgi:hypothetical protein